MTVIERMDAPPLIVRAPRCPLCYGETVELPDGGWGCDPCCAFWPAAKGAYGVVESDVGQCTARSQPFKHRGHQFPGLADRVYRCVRDAGHPRSRSQEKSDAHVGVLLTDEGPDPDSTWEWASDRE